MTKAEMEIIQKQIGDSSDSYRYKFAETLQDTASSLVVTRHNGTDGEKEEFLRFLRQKLDDSPHQALCRPGTTELTLILRDKEALSAWKQATIDGSYAVPGASVFSEIIASGGVVARSAIAEVGF